MILLGSSCNHHILSLNNLANPSTVVFSVIGTKCAIVITPRHIEELDDKGRLLEDEYPYYGVTEEWNGGDV